MTLRAPGLLRIILEDSALFGSVFKWTLLASGVGILVGFSTTLFLGVLGWATSQAGRLPGALWLLPPGFLLSHLLVQYLAPDAEGHGTEKVIEAVHQRSGRIEAKVAPVKLTATVLTVAVGGSVGKEGPCAQIGAALASSIASVLRLRPSDRRKIVICGISAGFATVFGTPIAGSLFGIEVLYLGSILYDVLYPSFVAGIVSYQVSSRLGVTYFREAVYGLPKATEGTFLKVVLAGMIFGVVALLLVEVLRRLEELARRLPGPGTAKALAGGGLLAILAAPVSPRYLGLGIDKQRALLRPLRASSAGSSS